MKFSSTTYSIYFYNQSPYKNKQIINKSLSSKILMMYNYISYLYYILAAFARCAAQFPQMNIESKEIYRWIWPYALQKYWPSPGMFYHIAETIRTPLL